MSPESTCNRGVKRSRGNGDGKHLQRRVCADWFTRSHSSDRSHPWCEPALNILPFAQSLQRRRIEHFDALAAEAHRALMFEATEQA